MCTELWFASADTGSIFSRAGHSDHWTMVSINTRLALYRDALDRCRSANTCARALKCEETGVCTGAQALRC
jgi:hypothetical protein